MKINTLLTHEFVEFIPDILKDRTIYVSIKYATAVHKCCCGCGNKVVTPLSPKDWKLVFDGESISLYPSIGNWSFNCKSHYWIRENKVVWADKWEDNKTGTAKGNQPEQKKNNGKEQKRNLFDFLFRKRR